MIINTYDAKTNLSKLLERVKAGETVTIASAGKPVADLVPHQANQNHKKDFFAAIGTVESQSDDPVERIRELRDNWR